jgi:predicted nuclease of predicted toxin-antitoxin system
MKFLLDEGVPVSVGNVLVQAGHEVIFFDNSGLTKGSPDPVVCAAAMASDAILVAADHDMKRLAKAQGISNSRFKTLGLVRFECPNPIASKRMQDTISLVAHENTKVADGLCQRLFVVIGETVIRVYR